MPRKKFTSPIMILAKFESEIASYKVPPPKPWPWVIDINGRTNIMVRFHQLSIFIQHLRKGRIPVHDGRWSQDFKEA